MAQDSSLITHNQSLIAPDSDEVFVRAIGQWSMVWRRFLEHRLAVASAVILLLLFAVALLGQLMDVASVTVIKKDAVTPPPVFAPRLWPFDLSRLMGTLPVDIASQVPIPNTLGHVEYTET